MSESTVVAKSERLIRLTGQIGDAAAAGDIDRVAALLGERASVIDALARSAPGGRGISGKLARRVRSAVELDRKTEADLQQFRDALAESINRVRDARFAAARQTADSSEARFVSRHV